MEKRTYFMFVHKGDVDGYWCDFPDVPGCFSDGDNLEDLMKNASDALESWLDAAPDTGIAIPEPSDADALKAKADSADEPVLFVVPVTAYLPSAPVRINITSTEDKIAEITAFAKRTHRTRSELMVAATLAYVRANA